MRPQLLIDTDPGVDDALAILMAHQHGSIRGLAVTAGNTGLNHTVRNACALVDLLASDAPVFAGCPEPLVRAPDEDAVHVHGRDGFGDVGLPPPGDVGLPPPDCKPGAEHAALAMIRMTREQPGELTLVALAPLTNLALAVRLDPAFPSRVGRLVIMGGAVNGHGNMRRSPVEFNIGFDPEAAHIVFSAFDQFDLVDWELTVRHAFEEAQFDCWLDAGDKRADLFRRISGKSRQYNAKRERRGVIAADARARQCPYRPGTRSRTILKPGGNSLGRFRVKCCGHVLPPHAAGGGGWGGAAIFELCGKIGEPPLNLPLCQSGRYYGTGYARREFQVPSPAHRFRLTADSLYLAQISAATIQCPSCLKSFNPERVMKPEIHPQYKPVVFQDMSSDFSFLTQSTMSSKETIKWEDGNEYPLIKVDVSSHSHPFYTGKQKTLDAGGRVDKFRRRYGK